jgi:hypothetical protein
VQSSSKISPSLAQLLATFPRTERLCVLTVEYAEVERGVLVAWVLAAVPWAIIDRQLLTLCHTISTRCLNLHHKLPCCLQFTRKQRGLALSKQERQRLDFSPDPESQLQLTDGLWA